jgi:HK97 gp10 family phage protein
VSDVQVDIDDEAIRRRVKRGIVNGLLSVQLVISRLLRSELSRAGGGRRYRVARGRRNGRNLRAQGIHVASAAGAPPAVDTGRLRQSWALAGNADRTFGRKGSKTTQTLAAIEVEDTGDRVGFSYGSNLKYARFLEFGTRRIRPRPYVRPVFDAVSKRAERIIGTAAQEEIDKP